MQWLANSFLGECVGGSWEQNRSFVSEFLWSLYKASIQLFSFKGQHTFDMVDKQPKVVLVLVSQFWPTNSAVDGRSADWVAFNLQCMYYWSLTQSGRLNVQHSVGWANMVRTSSVLRKKTIKREEWMRNRFCVYYYIDWNERKRWKVCLNAPEDASLCNERERV